MYVWKLLVVCLLLSCSSSSVLIWNVKYATGERERDKIVAELKAKKIKCIVKKSIQDIYEIRFKEK
jgi:hypothetical protein